MGWHELGYSGRHSMNTKNALGFLFVGVGMNSLPVLEPHWFAHLGPDGTSAAAAWVTCMGLVQALLGGGYLLKHHIWPSLVRMAQRPAPESESGEMALQRVSR